MNSNALAVLGIDVILEEEEERQLQKNKKVKKKIWSKHWFINRNKFSNKKLLKRLKESEPQDYKNYMRMSDQTFNDLLSKVKVYIEKMGTIMREAISVENRLAITLRFLATGNSFEDMKFSYAVSPQSISCIVIETCEAIIKVLKDFIKVRQLKIVFLASVT